MAKTLPVRFEAVILDEQMVEAKAIVYALVDPTASFATIIETLHTWLYDMDVCTDGQITSSYVVAVPDLPAGLKTDPVTGSRVEQTGDLVYRDASGTTRRSIMLVPALSNDPTVISRGKIILTAGAPVRNLVDLLASGGTAALEWTSAFSQALVSFSSALISFRSYNEQLGRETYTRL